MRIIVFTLLAVGILGLVFLEQIGDFVFKNFYAVQQNGEYVIINPSERGAVHAILVMIFVMTIILGCVLSVYKYFYDIRKDNN